MLSLSPVQYILLMSDPIPEPWSWVRSSSFSRGDMGAGSHLQSPRSDSRGTVVMLGRTAATAILARGPALWVWRAPIWDRQRSEERIGWRRDAQLPAKYLRTSSRRSPMQQRHRHSQPEKLMCNWPFLIPGHSRRLFLWHGSPDKALPMTDSCLRVFITCPSTYK